MKSNPSKEELDNRSNQLNDNNDAYWNSRGLDGKPEEREKLDDDDDFQEIDYSEDADDGYMSDDY